jgi:hypothetical protein
MPPRRSRKGGPPRRSTPGPLAGVRHVRWDSQPCREEVRQPTDAGPGCRCRLRRPLRAPMCCSSWEGVVPFFGVTPTRAKEVSLVRASRSAALTV